MNERPQRIQLSRRKGFDLQAASRAINGRPAVAVARPSKFGNPFKISDAIESGYATRQDAAQFVVDCFRDWLVAGEWWTGPAGEPRRKAMLSEIEQLRGKNLACWCKPGAPCHADELIERANGFACEEA